MLGPSSSLCCIITGASRGYGRCVAISIAATAQASSSDVTFILVARSKEGLEETLTQVRQKNPSAKGHCVDGDLAEISTLPTLLDRIFNLVTPSVFSHTLLINNAGSLGDVSKHVREFSDVRPSEIQKYTDINITSPFMLTSRFLQAFQQTKRYIINISSLMAVQGFPGFSLYCTGKAARDMLHDVVAKEEENVRILNFAPGPLDTDMNDQLVATTCNAEAKQMLKKENILQPQQSSDKLAEILKEDSFTSGAHLDYYDC